MEPGDPNQRPPPRLLERVRTVLRTRHYSPRTEEAYLGWIRRFIRHHDLRHPDEMGAPEVAGFLSSLAVERRVSAATQNQARNALLFLYRRVLRRELEDLGEIVPAQTPRNLPTVLSRDEVRALLGALPAVPRLACTLLYGSDLLHPRPPLRYPALRSPDPAPSPTDLVDAGSGPRILHGMGEEGGGPI